jgi:hypothetical protein
MQFNDSFWGAIRKAITESLFNRDRDEVGYPHPTPPHVFRITAENDNRIDADGDARITADSNY